MTNQIQSFGKVAVLYGGDSAEREVSLISGKNVYEALKSAGVDAHLCDTKDHEILFSLKKEGFERAFIMLHGRGGEDGQAQAILDWQSIPYTGSGVLACALSMDKTLTKRVWKSFDLPVKPDLILDAKTSYETIVKALGGTKFAIKPALEGSSVGISCIENQQQLLAAFQKAGGSAEKIMAESWISGRELTYGVIAGEVLPGIEIIASKNHLFYDYDAKYLADDTRYLCPPPISAELDEKLKQLALTAFNAIGARGWARIDFMIDDQDEPWLLEINMSPGMTSHSLVPQAARVIGLDFQALVLRILQQTL